MNFLLIILSTLIFYPYKALKSNCEKFLTNQKICLSCNSKFFNNTFFNISSKGNIQNCTKRNPNLQNLTYFVLNSTFKLNCSINCPQNVFTNIIEALQNATTRANSYEFSNIEIILLGNEHQILPTNTINTSFFFRRIKMNLVLKSADCNQFSFFSKCFQGNSKLIFKNSSFFNVFIAFKLFVKNIDFLSEDFEKNYNLIIYQNSKFKYGFFNLEPLIDEISFSYPILIIEHCSFFKISNKNYNSLINSFGFGVNIITKNLEINKCYFSFGILNNLKIIDSIYEYYSIVEFEKTKKNAQDKIYFEINIIHYNPLNFSKIFTVVLLNLINFFGFFEIKNSNFFENSVSNIFDLNFKSQTKKLTFLMDSVIFNNNSMNSIFKLYKSKEIKDKLKVTMFNCSFINLENAVNGFVIENNDYFICNYSKFYGKFSKSHFFKIKNSNLTISQSIFKKFFVQSKNIFLIKILSDLHVTHCKFFFFLNIDFNN